MHVAKALSSTYSLQYYYQERSTVRYGHKGGSSDWLAGSMPGGLQCSLQEF